MSSSRMSILVLLAACLASVTVSARYLPTRSQDNRLDRLRELLKDLLDSQVDNRQTMNGEQGGELGSTGPVGFGSGRSVIYKREADSPRRSEILSPSKFGVPVPKI